VSRVEQQLLAVFDLAGFDGGFVLSTLEVLDAVLGIREEALGLGTLEVHVRFARSAVTISRATIHQLRQVAPFPLVIVQIVLLAQHVGHTTIITLPEP